jgi:hypothetical protein
MIATFQKHEQKWLSGPLCSLSLNSNHPLESFFIQDDSLLGRYAIEQRVRWI